MKVDVSVVAETDSSHDPFATQAMNSLLSIGWPFCRALHLPQNSIAPLMASVIFFLEFGQRSLSVSSKSGGSHRLVQTDKLSDFWVAERTHRVLILGGHKSTVSGEQTSNIAKFTDENHFLVLWECLSPTKRRVPAKVFSSAGASSHSCEKRMRLHRDRNCISDWWI